MYDVIRISFCQCFSVTIYAVGCYISLKTNTEDLANFDRTDLQVFPVRLLTSLYSGFVPTSAPVRTPPPPSLARSGLVQNPHLEWYRYCKRHRCVAGGAISSHLYNSRSMQQLYTPHLMYVAQSGKKCDNGKTLVRISIRTSLNRGIRCQFCRSVINCRFAIHFRRESSFTSVVTHRSLPA